MLCVFGPSWKDAGRISREIEAELGALRHEPWLQERKEGCFDIRSGQMLERRWPTIDEALPFALEHFPAGHEFGNGCTANALVTLRGGIGRVRCTWVVLGEDLEQRIARDEAAYNRLREIVMGRP